MSHTRSAWPLGPFVAAVVAGLAARAQSPCAPTATPHAENVLPGTAAAVLSMVTWDPDGAGPQPAAIVASGNFGIAGTARVGNVARLDPVSNTWSPLGSLPTAAKLFVGPQQQLFARAGQMVSRWTDGTWAQITPVEAGAFVVLPNGDLVVGGWFDQINGVPANGLARYDGVAWHDMGLPAFSSVRALLVRANGSLVIAGELFTSPPVPTGVALWNNGVLTFPSGAPSHAALLAEYPNGDLLVFAEQQQTLHRWNGATWTAVTTTPAPGLRHLRIAANGDLYAGGNFASFEGIAASGIARHGNGVWQALGSGVAGTVDAIELTSQGHVIVGGSFGTAGGVTALHVARWNGSSWSATATTSGLAGLVQAIAPLPNGDVVVAGALPSVVTASGTVTHNIVRRSNGQWHALGSGTDTRVLALARAPNGDLVAGGTFAQAGGVPCARIARWNGQSWHPLGSGMDGYVHTVAVQGNGDVIAGGYFTTAGGVPAPGLARWNGSAWSSLGAFNGGVEAVVVAADGSLVAGGAFTTINGQPHASVARYDGTAWLPMGTGLRLVRFLTVARGAEHASDAGGVWRWDGTSWISLPPAAQGSVSAFGVLPGGDLAIAHQRIVRRFDGAAWSVLAELTTAPNLLSSGAFALAADTRGQLWLGGGFAGALDPTTGPANGEVVSPVVLGVDSSCMALASSYGVGCAGCAGVVQLRNEALPWAGSTWAMRATNVPTNAPFAFGVIGPAWVVQLQQVVPQGLPGCWLYPLPTPELLQLLFTSGGEVQLALAIPPAPQLLGLSWLAQVVPVELGAGGAITGFTSSNAILATIGGY